MLFSRQHGPRKQQLISIAFENRNPVHVCFALNPKQSLNQKAKTGLNGRTEALSHAELG